MTKSIGCSIALFNLLNNRKIFKSISALSPKTTLHVLVFIWVVFNWYWNIKFSPPWFSPNKAIILTDIDFFPENVRFYNYKNSCRYQTPTSGVWSGMKSYWKFKIALILGKPSEIIYAFQQLLTIFQKTVKLLGDQ